MPAPDDNAIASVDGVIQLGKIADVIDKVKKALDDIDPGRSAIMMVHNNTDRIMTLTGQSLDHGDFGAPPVAETPAHTTLIFSGRSTGLATGTSGHAFFAIGDTQFDVYWDNPFIGGNHSDLHATGPNALDFALHHAWGAGNQDAQMIYEIYPQPAAFGPMLVNKHSNLALDVPGFSNDDVLIQQYPPNGGANQRWIFTKRGGDGADSIYTLTNQSSQKCMDVVGGDMEEHAQIQQFGCHGGPNQQWRFQPTADGFYAIVSVNSGLCLDIPDSSGDAGVIVQQYHFHDGDNQKWRLQWEYFG